MKHHNPSGFRMIRAKRLKHLKSGLRSILEIRADQGNVRFVDVQASNGLAGVGGYNYHIELVATAPQSGGHPLSCHVIAIRNQNVNSRAGHIHRVTPFESLISGKAKPPGPLLTWHSSFPTSRHTSNQPGSRPDQSIRPQLTFKLSNPA